MYEKDIEDDKVKDLLDLVTRKKTSSFVEKILRYYNYDFDHDRYKEIIYGNVEYKTGLEERYKNYVDAYFYLISNARNPLTTTILNKFFFIIYNHPLDISFAYEICKKVIMILDMSTIECAVEFYVYLKEKLTDAKEDERTIISLMFINYILVKHNKEMIKFSQNEVKKILELKKREDIYLFISNQISKNKVLPKGYLKKLKKLEADEIIKIIKEDEINLRTKFMVSDIFLYGSYAKGINRIDSDIDLLISLSNNLTYLKREKIIEDLKEYFFTKFNRFVDIQEYRYYFSDEIIKELKYIEKVI